MKGKFANVIVEISHEKLDWPFQYLIPERLQGKIAPGVCVMIPFGAANKLIRGYVVEVTDRPEFEESRMKELAGRADGSMAVEEKLIQLAAWMKETYGSTMIQALKTVLPVKKTVRSLEKREICLRVNEEEARAAYLECVRKKQTARARLLGELLRCGELPYELVTGKLNVSGTTMKGLEEKGLITIRTSRVYRNPVSREVEASPDKILSEEQNRIVEEVLADYDAGRNGTYLIHGITGSGKTEVYMELIARMIQRGKQAIVLIPEIALTYQTVLRFYRRFKDRVSVINSTLSQGEKYDQCERAKKGELDVIIGPRSALFTPFPNLGLIIIDEEHEGTYKSEVMPRYHARETAEQLAKLHGASLVLGSATPSLEAYSRAESGEYRKFELTRRLTGGMLPEVYTVDLREELREGNRSIFSRKLQELLAERLERGEQAMLFLNRRGYAGFISCRACGHVLKCPHCDVSLSEHKNGKLICHYCGYTTDSVKICPECGSKYISGFRAGTQQIEEKLHALFPRARILRMDADTTRSKDSYEEILSAFANKEADVLIGTQMIVKGHDFPGVTLMGILAADMSLSAGDYRSAERTFQLLTQAAGRAGRGDKPGEVVIQTYQPEHYAIVQAAKQDYQAFYAEEMLYRELMNYPPACHLFAVLITGKEEKKAEALAKQLTTLTRQQAENEEGTQDTNGHKQGACSIQVIGPAPAFIGKMNDIYRQVFYVKCKEYKALIRMKDMLESFLSEQAPRDESVQFDFDPMHLF